MVFAAQTEEGDSEGCFVMRRKLPWGNLAVWAMSAKGVAKLLRYRPPSESRKKRGTWVNTDLHFKTPRTNAIGSKRYKAPRPVPRAIDTA